MVLELVTSGGGVGNRTVIDLEEALEAGAGKILYFDLWDGDTGTQIGKHFNICAFYYVEVSFKNLILIKKCRGKYFKNNATIGAMKR